MNYLGLAFLQSRMVLWKRASNWMVKIFLFGSIHIWTALGDSGRGERHIALDVWIWIDVTVMHRTVSRPLLPSRERRIISTFQVYSHESYLNLRCSTKLTSELCNLSGKGRQQRAKIQGGEFLKGKIWNEQAFCQISILKASSKRRAILHLDQDKADCDGWFSVKLAMWTDGFD